jgi:hypothetical protein
MPYQPLVVPKPPSRIQRPQHTENPTPPLQSQKEQFEKYYPTSIQKATTFCTANAPASLFQPRRKLPTLPKL